MTKRNKIIFKNKNINNVDENNCEVLNTSASIAKEKRRMNQNILKPQIVKEFGNHSVVCYSLQVLFNNRRLGCSIRKAQHIIKQHAGNFENCVGYFENSKSHVRFYVRSDCIDEFNDKLLNKRCRFEEKEKSDTL